MIEVKPYKENLKNKFDKIYNSLNINPGTDNALLIAKENDKLMGIIAVDIFKHFIRILNINIYNCSNNDLILDLLIRSAASYALNRNIFTIQSLDTKFFNELKNFNFYKVENSLFVEIYKLPKSCKQ